jgi:hypothetical protein
MFDGLQPTHQTHDYALLATMAQGYREQDRGLHPLRLAQHLIYKRGKGSLAIIPISPIQVKKTALPIKFTDMKK